MPRHDLSVLQLEARHLALLQQLLAQQVPHAEVWAYGSRVTGGCHETSDLDLVLRNPDDLTKACEGRFDLQEALQQSLLPLLVDVHDWAQLPDSFHRNIEQNYVVVQE